MNTPFKNEKHNQILVEGTTPYDFESNPELWDEINLPPHFEGKYALVEIFRTTWEGFDDVWGYKMKLYSLGQQVREYFEVHNEKRVGIHEKWDKRTIDKTLDQNHMMLATISDNKNGLQAISKSMPDDILQILEDNRYFYNSTLIQKPE